MTERQQKMKKIVLFIACMILSMNVYSKITPGFRVIADMNLFPFYYENTHSMYGMSINGALMAGMRLDKFTIGLEMSNNYNSLTKQNDSSNLNGAWNIMRWTFDGYYEPVSWFELKFGIGGAWYRSAFSNKDAGTLAINQGGLSVLLDGSFVPWKYVTLRQINRLDLFFSNSGSATPYYYGGVRCDFHPYIQWLSLYIEIGGTTFFNDSRPIDEFETGMFTWGTGISIDITPARFIGKKEEGQKVEEKKEPVKEEKKEVIKDTPVNKEIEDLKKAKEGDIITFSNILFYPDKDTIKEESFTVMDQIASVLSDRQDIRIELIGNTNDVGNKVKEIELSKKRAETVKKYLVNKGINADRITTTGNGSKFTKGANIDEANRKVEIKIIK
jgi:outer membrane protein OmpA-like peptidoglycan-associated protein